MAVTETTLTANEKANPSNRLHQGHTGAAGMSILPVDSGERKKYPLFSGVWRYFPSALIGVSRVSYEGNAKHNPGQSLQHDRAKSGDELDAHLRHLIEAECECAEDLPDGVDPEDPVVWRVLSWSQKRKEARGAPIAPAAVNADVVIPPPPNYNPDDVTWYRKRDGIPADSVDIARGPLAGPEDRL